MIVNIKHLLKEKFTTLYFFYQYIGNNIFLVFGFSALMVIMDSLGLTLFIPLLQVADSSGSSTAVEDKSKIDAIVNSIFNFLGVDVTISSMLVVIVLLFTIKGFFYYFSSKYNAVAQQSVMLKMRTKLASSIKSLSYKEFVMTDIGRLQNTVLAEVWQVINASIQYLETIKNVLFVVIYLGFAFFMDWRFSLLVILGGLFTNWVYKFFYTKTQQLSRDITKNNHRYGAIVIEVINHYKYFKATGRSNTFFGRLQYELETLVKSNMAVAKLNAKLSAIREPMTIVVICAVIYLHVNVFKSPLSEVIIILLFFYRVMQKIVDIQTNWNNYLSQIGAVENVIDYQKYLDKNKDSFYIGSKECQHIRSITLQKLSVKYGDVQVLNNVDLNIGKNQSVAFVGESGSGKTTLVNVLTALLPYETGAFFINDEDIRNFDVESYKSRIGYISQEPTVFNASIYDNITFWSDRSEDNYKRFMRVIEMCSLTRFIEELEYGEDTLLGNNGLNISGGQKQRISIARELFRDVDILIMDEATSALDSETENDIRESLDLLQGKITIIAIAHRLSTVKNVDCLYLLDKGQIVASGDFEELKDRSTYFKRLTELQGM